MEKETAMMYPQLSLRWLILKDYLQEGFTRHVVDDEIEETTIGCANRINLFLKTRELDDSEREKIKEIVRTHRELDDACLAFLCNENERIRKELEVARGTADEPPRQSHELKDGFQTPLKWQELKHIHIGEKWMKLPIDSAGLSEATLKAKEVKQTYNDYS
eukprot:762781-Hanusia_phi.AAC.25